jgi:hypothetical protein
MKKIFFTILISGFALSCIDSNKKNKSDFSTESSYQGPPMFVLTEMNGRELKENAYFTIKYDNTFELKTGDGTIFNYTPYQHFGDDPLCNILAKDDRDRNTAICIKKQVGHNVLIMLENDEMISNFKGYKK